MKANLRKGTIYEEVTYVRQSAAIGRVFKKRYVGEINIDGKRKRFRSTNRANVEAFIKSCIEASPYTSYSTKGNGTHKDNSERINAIMLEQRHKFEEIKRQKHLEHCRLIELERNRRRITGRIPENCIRVLRYRLWADMLSFGVINGRPMHAENFGYWTITREKGKVFIACSTKPKVGYNKITTRENLTVFQSTANSLLQKLDEAFGKILRHGQFLHVVSREIRDNGDLYLEIKPSEINLTENLNEKS